MYPFARNWYVKEKGSDIEVVEEPWQRTLLEFVEIVKVWINFAFRLFEFAFEA